MTRDHFEDKHLGENNIKICLKEVHWEGTEYLAVAHSMGKWQGLVNMVMNLWVPQNAVAAGLSDCQEGLCPLELVVIFSILCIVSCIRTLCWKHDVCSVMKPTH